MARSDDIAEVADVFLGDFRRFHIDTARDELRAARSADPSWRRYQTFTDNRFAKPIEQVRLFGKIEFANESLGEVIRYIWTRLNEAAVDIWHEGGYHDALRMYVPGAGTFTGFEQLPEGVVEVHFYSVAPYARKIERGLSPKARRGVFRPTFTRARSLYGRSVRLTFSYTVPRDGRAVTRSNRSAKRGAYVAPVPSPIIYLRQGSFFQ